MNEARRVTMKDIAEEVGCNKSTVSLALRNRPEVAEETRRKVQAVAERLGYVPDPVLSAIAASRWDPGSHHRRDTGSTLAFVHSRRPQGDFSISRQYCAGAALAAQRRGYRMEEYVLTDYPNVQRLESVLVARGIRGMIYSPGSPADLELKLSYDFPRLAVVVCAFGWTRLPFNSVNFDWFTATQVCWRALHERGYRRIGAALFCHEPPAEDDFMRFGASLANELLLGKGDSVRPLLNQHADQHGFVDWVRKERPDAIIGFHSGLYSILRDPAHGLPRDIGFVSLQNHEQTAVAGTQFLREDTGITALEVLVGSIMLNERGRPGRARAVLVEPSFVDGPSLRPKPVE